MTAPTIADYLKYANLQMAAEALYDYDATQNGPTLVPGKTYLGALTVPTLTTGNRHASKMTATEVEISGLTTDWVVKQHISNTTTGFSGTLFFNASKNEYVMSFRSTEFIDDAARDNEATNSLEIKEKGWAFGQIDDMEQWYQSVKLQINGPLTVTGYSLGGHLSTAFNLMHPGAATQVINFNGAGVGMIEDGSLLTMQIQLPRMIKRFHDLREQAKTGSALESLMTSGLGKETYRELRAHWLGNLAGIPDSSLMELLKRKMDGAIFGPGIATPDMKADYELLRVALDRIMYVTNYAHWAPTLASGQGDARPANIPDRVSGQPAIAAESMDYQLAVLVAAREYSTKALSYASGVAGALGAPKAAQGKGAITNQFDLAATEVGDFPALSMVSHSQYRYGQEFNLFIEDQPLYRGNVNWEAVKASFRAPDIEARLLVPEYANNDFGDTHSLVLILDSLNVQNTFLKLIPENQWPEASGLIKTILMRASNLKANSVSGTQGKAEGDVLENVINGLADTFSLNWKGAARLKGNPDGGTWAITEKPNGSIYSDRINFYDKLKEVQEKIKSLGLTGKLKLLAAPTSMISRTDTLGFLGAVLTLKYLTPFMLRPIDTAAGAILESANINIATWVNEDRVDTEKKQLNGTLHFSDAYLNDRAKMLSWVIERNTKNLPDGQAILTNRTTDKWQFQDRTSSTTIDVSNTPGLSIPPQHFVIFGKDDDFADSITGNNASDCLYGGGGADTVDGGKGDDYLEGNDGADSLTGGEGKDILVGGYGADKLYGGAGSDTLMGGAGDDWLEGGAGEDTYIINTGDGHDTIVDSGTNRVIYNGKLFAGTFIQNKTTGVYEFFDKDGSNNGKPLEFHSPGVLTLDESSGSKITFQNQTSGEAFANVDFGFHLYKPFDDPQSTVIGDDGDNALGNAQGRARIQGMGGRDQITGGGADDILEGGAGFDVIKGMAGNDRLYTNNEITLAQAIDQGRTQTGTDIQGGWLNGGDGDDIIIGGADNDALYGAHGKDIIVGGAGNDWLDGDDDYVLTGFAWNVIDTGNPFDPLIGPVVVDSPQAGAADVLYGGEGNDSIGGHFGDDILYGEAGNDVMAGDDDNDILYGGDGVTRISEPRQQAANDSLWRLKA